MIESAASASRDFGITVILIASINRHESLELAEQVVAGLLTGALPALSPSTWQAMKQSFLALPFANLLKEAKRSGCS